MPMYLLKQPTTAPELYNVIGLVFINTMAKLGQLAAPLFLTTVGINLVISVNKRGKEAKTRIIKKSVFLIILGLLFINIWQGDILHYIGIFLLISYFLLPLSKYTRTAIIILIISISGFLVGLINYSSSWEIVAFKLANFWTLSGFFKNLLLSGFHPVFPWITFTLAGTLIGSFLLDSIEKKEEIKYGMIGMITGIFISITGLVLNFTLGKITFYPASISYVVFYIGLSLTIFSIAFHILDVKNKFKKTAEQISFLGSVSLSFYILHVLIGFSYFYLTSSLHSLIIYSLIPYILFVLLLIYIICYISKTSTGNGPLEYLMEKIIRR